MKKLFKRAALLLVCWMVGSMAVQAQDMTIPIDSEVRIGKLPNGLTYYIRHNEKPKGQADFYIAQKVGSILENDDQRGLAHFLEHMCFNGTTNFPGNKVIDWLETVGVKFGQNLNAYTAVDETVYNISNVPIAREEVQDSCLLILHDWANDLLLEDSEIEKERGVIHQEWRRAMVGQMRILENILPTIYPGSRYGYRLPIGTMDVVDNFAPQTLRDYYEAWYRPDQQGIVVVGDIDVDRIEGKIKEMFADIEMPENAPERVYFPVEDNEGTIYAIGSDKEQTNNMVTINFKTDAFPNEMKNTVPYLIQKYAVDMISTMLNNRFNDIGSKPDAPFAYAGSDYENFFLAKTKDAFSVTGVAKDDNILPVLESIYREALRAARGGFTAGEYDRARNEYLSKLEKAYNNRNERESGAYVREYVRHFIDNEPIPSIEYEYNTMNALAPMLSVDVLNQILPELISDNNRVVMALLSQKEGVEIPTEEQFAAVIAAVDAEDIEPYVDEMKSEPLIPELPTPGSIVSETHNDMWDATEIVLSNGVKVLAKPTKFKADEILFTASAKGGTSGIANEYPVDLKMSQYALSQNGLGEYTNLDLQKYLSGKQASVGVDFNDYDREVSGSTTPKDLPTLMELVYMTFTNLTLPEDEYKALQSALAGILRNQETNPQFIFQRDLQKAMIESESKQVITPEDVLAADRESIAKIAHAMTADASDYLFTFVGNVDMEQLRPLLEQYIATLPTNSTDIPCEVEKSLEFKKGNVNETFTTKMETPQTYVFIAAKGEIPYTSKDVKLASIAGQILSKRLLDTVREDMGAVYSIGARGSLSRKPGSNVTLMTSFPMKPEMKQEVLDFIRQELNNIQTNITAEELNKVIEFMVKEATEDKEVNGAWASAMQGWNLNGVDTFNGNIETLQSITVDDVQNFIANLMKQGNYAVVVLDPEATAAE